MSDENVFVTNPTVDWSEPMKEEGILTPEQVARGVALGIVKPLLTATGLASRTPPSVDDLIALADWMLTGSPKQQEFPFAIADAIVLGPNVIATDNGAVINWGGVNYLPDEEDSQDPEEPA